MQCRPLPSAKGLTWPSQKYTFSLVVLIREFPVLCRSIPLLLWGYRKSSEAIWLTIPTLRGDTHLSLHSWSLVSFHVSSVWKRQLIFSILQIPLTRRQFWKPFHYFISFFFMLRSLKFCRLSSHGSCALPHNSPLLAGASQYLSTVFGWAYPETIVMNESPQWT